MKTFELILYPPKSFIPCKWRTIKANSIEEFAEICDNDLFIAQLFSIGWTVAAIREVG